MSTSADSGKRIYLQHGDALRTVPLHRPESLSTPTVDLAVKRVAPAQLTYRNGPLLTAPEVFTLFWGTAWESAQAALLTQINQFFDYVLTSALMDQLAEYSVPAYTIGHGRRVGTATTTNPVLPASISDSAIQHRLQQEIATHPGLPAPSPNTLYFIYLPPGIKVVQGGSASCTGFCGYHNDIAGQIFYAVMPSPAAVAAPVAWPCLMPSLRPPRTNYVKPSPIPYPDRVGTTM